MEEKDKVEDFSFNGKTIEWEQRNEGRKYNATEKQRKWIWIENIFCWRADHNKVCLCVGDRVSERRNQVWKIQTVCIRELDKLNWLTVWF